MTDGRFFLPDAFRISYDEIDEEHGQIVKGINACVDQAVDGKLYSFQEHFDYLIECLGRHFTNEEKHMHSLKYHGLDWHHEHHLTALGKARSLLDRASRWGYADTLLIREFFVDIVYDVAHADLQFRDFLEEEGLIRQGG